MYILDVDECADDEGICGVGECFNNEGSYECICPPGFMLMPNGRDCVDMRRETCYMKYTNQTGCSKPMQTDQTKIVCCCSMGEAWGLGCEECPKQGTGNIPKLW